MQAMLCGTRSFSDIDEGSRAPSSRLSKLKKSLSLDRGKKQISSSSSSKINPYSSEGLDKFEKLLAELAEKKKQVLLIRKGGYNDDGDDSVRFGYNSDTGDWVPTIVKKAAETKKKVRSVPKEKEVLVKEQLLVGNKVVVNKRSRWNAHSHCCFIVLLLLLLLLSCFMFGRSFVVCSVTVVWYLLPNWNFMKRFMSTDHKWLRRN